MESVLSTKICLSKNLSCYGLESVRLTMSCRNNKEFYKVSGGTATARMKVTPLDVRVLSDVLAVAGHLSMIYNTVRAWSILPEWQTCRFSRHSASITRKKLTVGTRIWQPAPEYDSQYLRSSDSLMSMLFNFASALHLSSTHKAMAASQSSASIRPYLCRSLKIECIDGILHLILYM